MVHGVGSGINCFWVADQVGHDTNLTVEVIRRTLLKIEESNGHKCNGEQFRSAAQLSSWPMNFSRGLTKKEVSNYNLR